MNWEMSGSELVCGVARKEERLEEGGILCVVRQK